MTDPRTLIDFGHTAATKQRRPILIAHRGGVVTSDSPENSLAAIRLAAGDGYDLVELDVVIARDDEPVIFHGIGAERRLTGTSGGDAPVAGYTSRELAAFHHDGTDERIAMLDEALALCRTLELGVMLDFKLAPGTSLSRRGVERVATLLDQHGLATSTMTITQDPLVLECMPSSVLTPVPDEEVERVAVGEERSLVKMFWFGLPGQLPEARIEPLQAAGALVIPAINVFRYPREDHEGLARKDIERLQAAGVDGFQIDSIYRGALPSRA